MSKKIIWFIDENEHQSKVYAQELNRLMSEVKDVSVERIFPPYRAKEAYLPIINNPATACIVIDQKLKDTHIATYTGTELARYLRTVADKLPIYILTNFAEDEDLFEGEEWSVEDIIPKDRLADPKDQKIITARLLRRLNVFSAVLEEREGRLKALLQKSLNGSLLDEESQELNLLKFDKSAPTLLNEAGEAAKLGRLIDVNTRLLMALENESEQENDS